VLSVILNALVRPERHSPSSNTPPARAGDILGLVLNLGNAAMCAATVAATVVKRRGHRLANDYYSTVANVGDGCKK
jgi:hypothetical protein